MIRMLLPLLLLLCARAEADERPCGQSAPCAIENGEYYLAFPPEWNGSDRLPALVFFHGHASSGEAVLESDIPATFGAAGYLVIAPNGAILPGRGIRAWPARRMPAGHRDDLSFVLAVMADVAERVPLARDRVFVGGFSAGGSMAWLVACYEGRQFAAFVPVAGALRRPMPSEGCPGGPVRMLHIHGFSDTQVPLEGRRIRDWHQGDVFQSLDRLRRIDGCASLPSRIELGAPLRCRIWSDCASGRDIRLCLHDGGHQLPDGWAAEALTWFENGSSAEPP